MRHYKTTDGILLVNIKEYTDEYVVIEYSMEQGNKKEIEVLRENFIDLDSYIKNSFTVIEIL